MYLQNINYNHLYYFHIIAHEGSLAKAAKILSVTQPTLSHQLGLLENNFGAKLFERKGKTIKLNQNGKYLFDYTQQIFSIVNKMITGFQYNQNINIKNNIRIGLAPSVSRSFAAQLLNPLLSNEKIGLKVIESSLKDAIEQLHSLELDFILSEEPEKNLISDTILVKTVKKPSYHFVCGKKFKNRKIKTPKEFESIPYFKYSANNSIQKAVDQYFYNNQSYPSIIGESDDLSLMIAATRLNNCFSIVPIDSVSNYIETGEIIDLGEFKNINSKICALYLKEIDNKEIEKVIDLIKN